MFNRNFEICLYTRDSWWTKRSQDRGGAFGKYRGWKGWRGGRKRDPRLRSLFKSTSPLSIQYIIFSSTYNTRIDLVTIPRFSKIELNLLFFDRLIGERSKLKIHGIPCSKYETVRFFDPWISFLAPRANCVIVDIIVDDKKKKKREKERASKHSILSREHVGERTIKEHVVRNIDTESEDERTSRINVVLHSRCNTSGTLYHSRSIRFIASGIGERIGRRRCA